MSHTSKLSESIVATDVYHDLPVVKDSTTSRVLVNNSLLRHVMFSMDTGQVLTEHSSPRAVIVNILVGKLAFTIDGVVHEVEAGDVIYLAPNERHAVEALDKTYMSLTLVVAEDGGDN